MILLKTQKSELFEAIRQFSLSPLFFECDDHQFKRKKSTDEDKDYTIVRVKDQPILFFKVTVNPNNYYLYYSPDDTQRINHFGVYNWKRVIVDFKLWVQRVRREILEPDKWKTLESLSQIFAVKRKDNTRFSKEEIIRIESSVENLRKEIIENSNFDNKQLKQLNENVNKCIRELKTSGRRDWYLLFINLILTEIISPDIFNKVWLPLGNWIYQNGFKLLGG